MKFAGVKDTGPMLAEPTGTQRRAFDLIGVPIPLTLKQPEQNPAIAPRAAVCPIVRMGTL